MRYTRNYSDEIERLKKEIASADRIIIGAGAGLSTAAGFTYSGERFERFFSDFESKYGFHDMYSGVFFLLKLPKKCGRTGRALSGAIAIQMLTTAHTKCCLSW